MNIAAAASSRTDAVAFVAVAFDAVDSDAVDSDAVSGMRGFRLCRPLFEEDKEEDRQPEENKEKPKSQTQIRINAISRESSYLCRPHSWPTVGIMKNMA